VQIQRLISHLQGAYSSRLCSCLLVDLRCLLPRYYTTISTIIWCTIGCLTSTKLILKPFATGGDCCLVAEPCSCSPVVPFSVVHSSTTQTSSLTKKHLIHQAPSVLANCSHSASRSPLFDSNSRRPCSPERPFCIFR
jgi:hypothetical protein